jgi:hypothetical protein
MNRKHTALTALLFAALFILASCEKKSRYGVLITDEIGMTHVLVTDANGQTVQDGNGHLVEVVTDSDSKKPIVNPARTVTVTDDSGSVVSEFEVPEEYQTQSITFPAFIENEDSVEVARYIMPKPGGWEMIGSLSIILKHTETETVIDTYEGDYSSLEEGLDDLEAKRAKLTEKDIPFTVEKNYKICGTTGIKCRYDLGDMQRYIYFVMMNDTVYRFGVSVKTEYDGKIDYEGILNGIKFR